MKILATQFNIKLILYITWVLNNYLNYLGEEKRPDNMPKEIIITYLIYLILVHITSAAIGIYFIRMI